jgi:hypothetical protein
MTRPPGAQSHLVLARVLAAACLALACLVAVANALAAPTASAPPSSAPDSREKAACVFNLVQYAQWPASMFKRPQDPLVLTVLGDNAFAQSLQQAARGKRVAGRSVVVRLTTNPSAAAKTSHLVFIPHSEKTRLDKNLRALSAANVVTVSDLPNFTAAGGVVQIFSEKNKLRFEINKRAADRTGVTFSAKLLKLARLSEHD